MKVEVFKERKIMGKAAAKAVEDKIIDVLSRQPELRMIFAAAPSQNEVLHYLSNSKIIPWSRIVAFHMDEYIGLPADSAATFAAYLRTHLFDLVPLKEVYFLDGNGGDSECQRYARLLQEKSIDIVCLGIGENGHIAFNDPPVANFQDPESVKVVALDGACRQQQVNDGCFPTLSDVPTHAMTLTIPILMTGRNLFCVVPGRSKAKAVSEALNGPVAKSCPASILRQHDNCRLFLDEDSFGENKIEALK